MWHFSPSVLWHCWLGDRKGIRPVKNWMLVCWWWWFDWRLARIIAPIFHLSPLTTSIILCFNKHRLTQVHLENGRQNGEREYSTPALVCRKANINGGTTLPLFGSLRVMQSSESFLLIGDRKGIWPQNLCISSPYSTWKTWRRRIKGQPVNPGSSSSMPEYMCSTQGDCWGAT